MSETRSPRLVAMLLAAALCVSPLLVATPANAADVVTAVDDATTQGAPSFSYSSGWTAGSGHPTASFHEGTEHWTNGGNVTATLTFRGTRAEIIGAKDPGHGYFFVSVDGAPEVRVDAYGATRQLQQTLFDTGVLTLGDHTVVLRMDGTRNPASNKPGAQLDFARVTAPSTVPENPDPVSIAPTTIPALTQWTGRTGSLTLATGVRVVVDPAIADTDLQGRTVRQEAEQLVADLTDTGLAATLAITASSAAGDIVLGADAALAVEAYRLSIADRVSISASSAAGLFYGGRTLLQALHNSLTLPAGETLDAPGQGMRGGMIDAGRKYWSIDYLKDLIRQMSYQKLNLLNLHLVESEGFRLDSPAFPGLADPANSYDEAEIRDLVAFAAEYHVDIMPGFEFPGHATVISDYFDIGFGSGPNACTAAHMHSHLTPDWVIDMTSDKGKADSAAILTEFLPWFDSKFVHLGGDELPGQLANCPRVQQYIADEPTIGSTGDMLLEYINELSAVSLAQGKRPIIFNGWEHMSRSQQTLDPNVIIQDWEGEGTHPAFAGHDKLWMNSSYVYLTPNNYHNSSPNLSYLTSSWSPRTDSEMLGTSFAVWADYNMWAEDEYFESKMVPLRAAVADRTWNVSARGTVADLTDRIARTGDAPGLTGFAPQPRVGAETPLHHYPFEPTAYPSGYTWAGSAGQTLFIDDTAGELNGSSYIIRNPSFVAGGIKGSALNFSGNGQGVGLGGVDLAGPWTVSVWVKQSAIYPDATLLSSRGGTSLLLRDSASGKVGMITPQGRVTFEATLPVGPWTAVSVVNDGTTTTLYIDGKPAGNVAASMALPLAAMGGLGTTMRGSIDELAIFDAALSAEQVAANYDRDSASLPKPGLVNYWSLDESTGVLKDSISGADATLEGGTRIDGVHNGGISLPGNTAGLKVGSSDIDGPWTAGMWVKRTAATTSSVLFAGSSTAIKLEQHKDTGKIGLTQFGIADHTINYSAPIGEWVHLTFTSNGTTVTAYANGEPVGTITASAKLGRAWIGKLASGNAVDAVKADIDEAFVYDRALSADDVRSLYAGIAQNGGAPIALTVSLSFPDPAPSELAEGSDVTAEVVVRNAGLVDLNGTTVAPRGDDTTNCVLPTRFTAGAEVRCTLTHRVTKEDVTRGFVSLILNAAATGTNPLLTPLSVASNELTATTVQPVRPITATIDGATPVRLTIGQPFAIDIVGPLAGSAVEASVNSDPVHVGSATVATDFTAVIRGKLDSSVPLGSHTLVIRATDSTGAATELRYAIQVVESPLPPKNAAQGGGSLANTGSNSSPLVALSGLAVLMILGGALVVIVRTRRSTRQQ